jgi:hypothetical protein
MNIPTEPIGSIPRPLELIEAAARKDGDDPSLEPVYENAVRDTVARFEATGSPVITDGEQRKYHNFRTYSVHGLTTTHPDGNCGFSPFSDDTSTSRDTAFAKIRSRVLGTALAADIIGAR